MSEERAARRFEDVVGAAHVGPGELRALDGVPVLHRVRPASATELAECLRVAHDARQPVVAVGGGTKLHWGHPPDARAVVLLDVTRLELPFELDPEEGVGSFGAGVRVEAIERAARGAGQRILAPSLPVEATLGGVIAADPIEPERAPGRRFRNDLLGLEVALADGALTRCGGRVVKNVTGFDLVRLYAGSFGTLGLITRATLRLRPLPADTRSLARACGSPGEALGAARALLGAGVEPEGVAVLPEAHGVRLLWMLEGRPAELEARAGRYPGDPVDAGEWRGVAARVADREPARTGTAHLRIGARPSDVLAITERLWGEAGSEALWVALPQSGIVRARLPEDALAGWIETCAQAGWAVLVERAALELRARVDVFGRPDATLPLMRALKLRFDPERLLAPGRFVGGL